MYLRENSMLPEAEQQRLLFEAAIGAGESESQNAKACLIPTSISKGRSKLMPTGGLLCRLQGKCHEGRLLDAVPLSSLTGVGAALSNKLAKINLHSAGSTLTPSLRYEDRTHLYPIGELLPGVYATVGKAKC